MQFVSRSLLYRYLSKCTDWKGNQSHLCKKRGLTETVSDPNRKTLGGRLQLRALDCKGCRRGMLGATLASCCRKKKIFMILVSTAAAIGIETS